MKRKAATGREKGEQPAKRATSPSTGIGGATVHDSSEQEVRSVAPSGRDKGDSQSITPIPTTNVYFQSIALAEEQRMAEDESDNAISPAIEDRAQVTTTHESSEQEVRSVTPIPTSHHWPDGNGVSERAYQILLRNTEEFEAVARESALKLFDNRCVQLKAFVDTHGCLPRRSRTDTEEEKTNGNFLRNVERKMNDTRCKDYHAILQKYGLDTKLTFYLSKKGRGLESTPVIFRFKIETLQDIPGFENEWDETMYGPISTEELANSEWFDWKYK